MARKKRVHASPMRPEIQGALWVAGLYGRLSVLDNGKVDGEPIESQIAIIEQYVAGHPELKIVERYIDNGYTGTNFDRPNWERMMADVKSGRINCIIVKDLSRLGRNYIETGRFLERICPKLGIRFISVNDNYDTAEIKSQDEFAASLKNIVNDYYAKDISLKSGSALKAKRQRGEYIGSYAPHGYLKDPSNKNHLIINPETAPVIQQIYQWRAEGLGYGTITRMLNERGIPSPGRYRFEHGIVTNNNKKGSSLLWNRHALTDILRNIVYIGHLAQGKCTASLARGIPVHRTPESEWDIAYLEHIFPFLGVRVIAVNDGYDSKQYEGKTGGMDIAFRNFMYENYSRDLSIKVRSAMHSRMKKGRFVNHVPYGYQKAPGDKHLMVPDPNTAPIVREIFQSIIRGKSTSQIAKELNTRGVLTPLAYKQHRLKPACQNRELMWSHITVLNILKNDKYTGVMTNHTRESRYMRDKNQRRVPREEWIITENTHEALVTKEEFDAAHAMIREVKRPERKSPPACDTVFYCGHCGRKLRKSHGLDTYFACDTQLYQENATCSNIRWSKTDLEAVMLPVYKAQLYLLGERAKELALQGDGHPNENWPEMVGKIDREIAACQAQKVQYYEAYRNGDLDRGAFVEQKAALAIRIEHLQGERTEIELKRQAQRTQIEARESAKRELSQYLYATHLDGALLTESMYQAIDRVKVFSNERIEIRWKFEDLFAGQGYRERKAV